MSETAIKIKERPIIFSAPMVRAILEGRKTQTRRIIKPQPTHDSAGIYWKTPHDFDGVESLCPYGRPGDRLWVREAWREVSLRQKVRSTSVAYRGIQFKDLTSWTIISEGGEDNPAFLGEMHRGEVGVFSARWRSPIHLPRWASRVTLEITDVRVQRVREISEADAIAEGCESHYCSPEDTASCKPGTPEREIAEILEGGFLTAKNDFINRWNDLNGAGSWKSNPWVWAITFRRIQP